MTVIVAANNEADWIGKCLGALLDQDDSCGPLQIVVSANACTDGTEDIVAAMVPRAEARGWKLLCISDTQPGKVDALNRGDRAARGDMRAYLDADVLCDPDLFGQLRQALDRPEPVYATGTLQVAQPRTWATRRYADFWDAPALRHGRSGRRRLFAVNAAGRARWGDFPSIISDDTFVRLQFTPDERHEVPARYHWPMVEGWGNLVRVRRRQDAGVAEIHARWPELAANEGKAKLTPSGLARLAAKSPFGFAVYAAVSLMVRLRPAQGEWTRGR